MPRKANPPSYPELRPIERKKSFKENKKGGPQNSKLSKVLAQEKSTNLPYDVVDGGNYSKKTRQYKLFKNIFIYTISIDTH